jgi:serine/threonine protein kinase
MDLIGQTIKHYEFRHLIASGGYGAVYEAMDTSINRLVAVKTILPHHANDPEFKQRFNTEVQLISKLEHPHIVPIYHYWQDEMGAFLVMRHISGGSLRQVMDVQGSLSLIQTQRIMRQICDALAVSHEKGIIHRDIKPENILIDTQGNAYLSDFGIAKNLHTDDDITATDSIIGSWKYLSPEQIQSQHISPQTDMYALGVMLYEMLTGKHPYDETTVTLMLVKHIQDPLPNIRLVRPDLPLSIHDVIQKATEKDPQARYASITTLATNLTHALEGIPSNMAVADTKANITKPIYTPAPLPKTSEGRIRLGMLRNVRKFWIEGVLETSLQNIELLDLGISSDHQSVNHPWKQLLNISQDNVTERLSSRQIMNYFENLNGKILVMGDPGAGKTTLLLNITEELLIRAELDPVYPIPVVLNLASWSQNQTQLEDWLETELHLKYQVPNRIAHDWVQSDHLTLMLDGLDEVDKAYRNTCIQAINAYREQHGFVDIVLCCRTNEYQELIDKAMLNGAIRINPLTDEQVRNYLNTLGDVGERTQRLIDLDPTFHELSRSPLTLRILVQTYRNVPTGYIEKGNNPIEQRRQLFELYCQEMINRRVNDLPYTSDEIRHHLGWLAKQMQTHNLSIFQIEDIQPSWLADTDQTTYTQLLIGTHVVSQAGFWGLPRLLQADEIIGMSNLAKTIIWMISGGAWGLALGSGTWIRHIIPLLCGVVFAMGITLDSSPVRGVEALKTLPTSLVIYSGLLYVAHSLMNRNGFTHHHIRTVELLSFSRHQIRPLAAIIGGLAGIATAFINSTVYSGPPATQTELLTGMILGALGGGLGAIFTSGLRSSPATTAIRPNHGIRQSLRNAIQVGLIIAFIFFITIFVATAPVSTVNFGITQGLISAFSFGFNGFIIFGGYSVIQHIIVRGLLARRGHIQPNLAQFLDTASSLLLLRKVGSGYIFIHRYLLEYFAEQDDVKN